MTRSLHIVALALSVTAAVSLPAAPARAQVALFLDTCVAEVSDLDRLPRAFAKAGLAEVDLAAGPPGPAFAGLAPGRRLWSAPNGSGMGESFAGYSPLGDMPLAVCWVVSRPVASAAAMLVELKRRFPPLGGTTSRGTAVFYGGSESWAAKADANQVLVGVEWPIQASPEQGTGMVYLVKPRP